MMAARLALSRGISRANCCHWHGVGRRESTPNVHQGMMESAARAQKAVALLIGSSCTLNAPGLSVHFHLLIPALAIG